MGYFKFFGSLGALVMAAFVVATSLTATAGSEPSAINTLGTDGVAIKGYDPVAYFTEGAPHKGSAEFAAEHNGVKWYFASAENKTLFEADPDKYTPAYGGYCAFGVSQGYLVKIEPDAWSIRDGKLYLNYDKSVQTKWAKKPAKYIQQADEQWPGLVAKK